MSIPPSTGPPSTSISTVPVDALFRVLYELAMTRSCTRSWHEALELRDVGRGQLLERMGAEQLHGADDLVAEDRDHPVHPGATACHESVEVGPADEGEPRAECDRRDDVGAVHDPGVHDDLEILPDLADHVRQQVEGDGGAVQLPAAVIGQHDTVHPEVREPLRVLDA